MPWRCVELEMRQWRQAAFCAWAGRLCCPHLCPLPSWGRGKGASWFACPVRRGSAVTCLQSHLQTALSLGSRNVFFSTRSKFIVWFPVRSLHFPSLPLPVSDTLFLTFCGALRSFCHRCPSLLHSWFSRNFCTLGAGGCFTPCVSFTFQQLQSTNNLSKTPGETLRIAWRRRRESAACSSCSSETDGHSWAPKVRTAAGRAAPPPCWLPHRLALITQSSTFTFFLRWYSKASLKMVPVVLSLPSTGLIICVHQSFGAQDWGRPRGCSWRCKCALGERVDMEV